MKKRVLAMVLALGMTFGLAGCAGSDKAADTSDKKESTDTESKDELTTVKWNYGSSGNVRAGRGYTEHGCYGTSCGWQGRRSIKCRYI